MAKNRISLSTPAPGCSSLGIAPKAVLLLISAALSGAAVAGFGGVLLICVSVGILAYAMCAGVNIFTLPLCAAISLGFSLLLGVQLPIALISLLYIPMAAVIWVSVRKRQGLSQTVAAMTVLLVLVGGGAFGVMLLQDRTWTLDFAGDLFSAYKEYLAASVNQLYSGSEGVPQNLIDTLVSTTVMVTPATVAIALMAFSYLSAKIFRLISLISDSSAMFTGHAWPITASLPHTMLFFVSSLIAFTVSDPIASYSASNLMLILLPGAALFGLNLLFGKNSRFRRSRSLMSKIALVLICIVSLYTGGVMLLYIASFYASYHNFRTFIYSKFKKED